MNLISDPDFSPARRFLLGALPMSFLLSRRLWAVCLPRMPRPMKGKIAVDEGEEFSFDLLTDWMRAMAAEPYEAPSTDLPEAIADLDYDAYRHIQFNAEQARWREEDSHYACARLSSRAGFTRNASICSKSPRGARRPLSFSMPTSTISAPWKTWLDSDEPIPGVAGFRLNNPTQSARYVSTN